MDLLIKDGAKLAPKDSAEGVAIFRAQVIGPLLTRVFASHGELAAAVRAIARERHVPPGASASRYYSEPTIERWYYRFKKGGLGALEPKRRSDAGHGRELTDEQRTLLCAIRREHPTTSAALIVRTLELDGRLAKPWAHRARYRESLKGSPAPSQGLRVRRRGRRPNCLLSSS